MKTLNLNDLLADLEKTASVEKPAVIKPNVSAELSSILEKKASQDMTASAFAAGEALAKELLTKLAGENAIQKEDDCLIADDDRKILPNETGGSINLPLENTVRNAIALGAISDDVVDAVEDGKLQKAAQLQTKSENFKMAQSIMEKIAQIVGEETTTPAEAISLGDAVSPNLIQRGNAQITAQDDAKVLPLPGAEGSLNNILEAVVARAEEQGAASYNLVDGDRPASGTERPEDDRGEASVIQQADNVEKVAAVDALVQAGCDFDSAVGMVKQAEYDLYVEADQQEKMAAIDTLIGVGYDFDSAVELVKQAEYALSVEGDEFEKIAAVNELVGEGYDFDYAVELVKEASQYKFDEYGQPIPNRRKDLENKVKSGFEWAEDKVRSAGGSAKADALEAARYAKLAATGKSKHGAWNRAFAAKRVLSTGTGKVGAGVLAGGALALGAHAIAKAVKGGPAKQALTHIGKHRVAYGAGAAGAAGAAGVAAAAYRHHEKKAAFDALVEAGVEFDQAIEMVKQAEYDVYGE